MTDVKIIEQSPPPISKQTQYNNYLKQLKRNTEPFPNHFELIRSISHEDVLDFLVVDKRQQKGTFNQLVLLCGVQQNPRPISLKQHLGDKTIHILESSEQLIHSLAEGKDLSYSIVYLKDQARSERVCFDKNTLLPIQEIPLNNELKALNLFYKFLSQCLQPIEQLFHHRTIQSSALSDCLKPQNLLYDKQKSQFYWLLLNRKRPQKSEEQEKVPFHTHLPHKIATNESQQNITFLKQYQPQHQNQSPLLKKAGEIFWNLWYPKTDPQDSRSSNSFLQHLLISIIKQQLPLNETIQILTSKHLRKRFISEKCKRLRAVSAFHPGLSSILYKKKGYLQQSQLPVTTKESATIQSNPEKPINFLDPPQASFDPACYQWKNKRRSLKPKRHTVDISLNKRDHDVPPCFQRSREHPRRLFSQQKVKARVSSSKKKKLQYFFLLTEGNVNKHKQKYTNSFHNVSKTLDFNDFSGPENLETLDKQGLKERQVPSCHQNLSVCRWKKQKKNNKYKSSLKSSLKPFGDSQSIEHYFLLQKNKRASQYQQLLSKSQEKALKLFQSTFGKPKNKAEDVKINLDQTKNSKINLRYYNSQQQSALQDFSNRKNSQLYSPKKLKYPCMVSPLQRNKLYSLNADSAHYYATISNTPVFEKEKRNSKKLMADFSPPKIKKRDPCEKKATIENNQKNIDSSSLKQKLNRKSLNEQKTKTVFKKLGKYFDHQDCQTKTQQAEYSQQLSRLKKQILISYELIGKNSQVDSSFSPQNGAVQRSNQSSTQGKKLSQSGQITNKILQQDFSIQIKTQLKLSDQKKLKRQSLSSGEKQGKNVTVENSPKRNAKTPTIQNQYFEGHKMLSQPRTQEQNFPNNKILKCFQPPIIQGKKQSIKKVEESEKKIKGTVKEQLRQGIITEQGPKQQDDNKCPKEGKLISKEDNRYTRVLDSGENEVNILDLLENIEVIEGRQIQRKSKNTKETNSRKPQNLVSTGLKEKEQKQRKFSQELMQKPKSPKSAKSLQQQKSNKNQSKQGSSIVQGQSQEELQQIKFTVRNQNPALQTSNKPLTKKESQNEINLGSYNRQLKEEKKDQNFNPRQTTTKKPPVPPKNLPAEGNIRDASIKPPSMGKNSELNQKQSLESNEKKLTNRNRAPTGQSSVASSYGPGKNVRKIVEEYIYMINIIGQAVAKTPKVSKKIQKYTEWYVGVYFLYKRFLYERKKIEKLMIEGQPRLTRYDPKQIDSTEWQVYKESEQYKALVKKISEENINIAKSMQKMHKKLMSKTNIPQEIKKYAELSQRSSKESQFAIDSVIEEYDSLVEQGVIPQDKQVQLHCSQMFNACMILCQLDEMVGEKLKISELSKTNRSMEEMESIAEELFNLFHEEE